MQDDEKLCIAYIEFLVLSSHPYNMVKRKTLHVIPNSPAPLYHQIYEDLRARIESGDLPPDSSLPTETELSQSYRVSRATVREALRLLAERGLIEKRHGIGSFVSGQRIVEKLPGINSFSTEMRLLGYGYDVRSEVLSKSIQTAPARVASLLELPPNSAVVQITRLRFVDERPFLISTSYLPPFISINEDFTGSIYRLFEAQYGILVSVGEASIEAGLATPEEARMLSINLRDSVLRITWIGRSEDDRPVEYSEGTYRGDRYRYVVQLSR